jgi:hypothetical protein
MESEIQDVDDPHGYRRVRACNPARIEFRDPDSAWFLAICVVPTFAVGMYGILKRPISTSVAITGVALIVVAIAAAVGCWQSWRSVVVIEGQMLTMTDRRRKAHDHFDLSQIVSIGDCGRRTFIGVLVFAGVTTEPGAVAPEAVVLAMPNFWRLAMYQEIEARLPPGISLSPNAARVIAMARKRTLLGR